MMYNLFLFESVRPDRLRQALVAVFDLAMGDVDVSDEEEVDSRNWDARVSCEYSSRVGDISQALGIYSTDDVRREPSERSLSLEMARILNTSVLFPEEVSIPSVWKVATPSGEVGFARIVEPEAESDQLAVRGSEIFIPDLPHVKISRFPEVIKEVRLFAPIVDSLFLDSDEGDAQIFRGLAVNWLRRPVDLPWQEQSDER